MNVYTMKYNVRVGLTVIIVINLIFLKWMYSFSRTHKKFQCTKFPQPEDIIIDHEIWQVLTTPKGNYKMMNAYVDDRENRTIIRVLLAGPELDITKDNLYCQFWFDDSPDAAPFVVKATEYFFTWNIGD